MNRAILLALVLALPFAIAGCSHEQVYKAIRDNRIQNCENLPIPQQEHCRGQYRTTWEEYSRDLEELRQESQPRP